MNMQKLGSSMQRDFLASIVISAADRHRLRRGACGGGGDKRMKFRGLLVARRAAGGAGRPGVVVEQEAGGGGRASRRRDALAQDALHPGRPVQADQARRRPAATHRAREAATATSGRSPQPKPLAADQDSVSPGVHAFVARARTGWSKTRPRTWRSTGSTADDGSRRHQEGRQDRDGPAVGDDTPTGGG